MSMKPGFTSLLLLLFSGSLLAQSSADYYTLPVKKEPGFEHHNTESYLKRFGEVRIRNRWYAGFNGFVRNDQAKLNNNFNDLIGTQSATDYGFGASVGWVSREQWTMELEYARSPIHNTLVLHGDYPQIYKMENDKNSILFRVKRRILFGKPSIRRSALWVGAGAGIVPNSGRQTKYREFIGYRSAGRRMGYDTLFITSDTRVSSHPTAALEASAEYILKVSKKIDISFFSRYQWGAGNSVRTELVYYVNGTENQSASITGNGTGLAFGVSLRYNMHLGYDFGRMNSSSQKETNL
ncbi:hypothetical protein DSL64_23780 [Dyadobacter luteus]|jgi:hypothetical protein|uniref:Outer membrane protein beta-barrel domain-containing protein n=2 Tax=Dyadobacter luteus TaxID=2259619 RepID=A0A3D8Y8B4_9BACT|nr:hypothetical protein DSL64_23780 [Dyadobacter luteus]